MVDILNNITTFINDRYGFYPFYCYNTDTELLFTSEPLLISRNVKKFDIDSNSVELFFKYGYLVDQATLIKNLRKIKPASNITICNSHTSFVQYWSWNLIRKCNNDSYGKAIDKLGSLFISSVERIMRKYDKVNLPLSGGLDSRAILAAIDNLGLTNKVLLTCTFGINNCDDLLIARKVSEIGNVDHKFIELNSERFWSNMNRSILNTMGSINVIHTHGSMFRQVDLSKPFINGFIGDLVFGGSYLNEDLIYKRIEFQKYAMNKMRSEGLNNLNQINLTFDNSGIDFNEKYNSPDYFFISRTRAINFTLIGGKVSGHRFKDAFPFLDNDFINYLYGLSDEWRIDSRIYRDVLLKFFPNYFRTVIWQKNGEVIEGYNNKFISSEYIQVEDFTKNDVNRIKNYFDYKKWLTDKKYEGYLREQLRTNNYYNKTEIEKLLDIHYSSDVSTQKDIGLLLTFSIFKKYIDDINNRLKEIDEVYDLILL